MLEKDLNLDSQKKTTSEEFNLENEFKKIPNQMAFKIGDVADLIQVKPYVLRYWEQEFKSLNPKKALNNQRIYSRRDVETVILIKKFLYVDQFSIAGARKALKEYKDTLVKNTSPAQTSEIQMDSIPIIESQLQMTDKYIQLEVSITKLISKIRSFRGKIEHKFYQIGL